MSTINEALFAILSTNAGVSALVDDRIYPHFAPTSAIFPRITYALISANHWECAGGSAGMVQAKYQISCWGTSSSSCEEVAEAVRQSLQGLHDTISGVFVDSALIDNEFQVTEEPQDASEQYIFVRHITYTITYRESVPTL